MGEEKQKRSWPWGSWHIFEWPAEASVGLKRRQPVRKCERDAGRRDTKCGSTGEPGYEGTRVRGNFGTFDTRKGVHAMMHLDFLDLFFSPRGLTWSGTKTREGSSLPSTTLAVPWSAGAPSAQSTLYRQHSPCHDGVLRSGYELERWKATKWKLRSETSRGAAKTGNDHQPQLAGAGSSPLASSTCGLARADWPRMAPEGAPPLSPPPGGWRMAGRRGRSSGPASTPGCWRRFRLHAGSPQLPQRHCNQVVPLDEYCNNRYSVGAAEFPTLTRPNDFAPYFL